MKQFQDLLTRVMTDGTRQSNRTGVDTLFIAGDMMRFNLQDGFPVITTRRGMWKSSIGEMIGFMNGYDNAEEFRKLKCKFWDANANKNEAWLKNPARKGEDDLGRVYGVQWRDWKGERSLMHGIAKPAYKTVDQFYNVINDILNNPTSRRILVSAWRPDEISQMALPPCHVLFQFLCNVDKKELNMSMYIRSNDLFLGAPANIIEYAFLLEAVAHATGYTAKDFTYFVSDAHIYLNHIEQVKIQCSREPFPLPKLKFNNPYPEVEKRDPKKVLEWLCDLHPDDFELEGYQHHPELTGEMAV